MPAGSAHGFRNRSIMASACRSLRNWVSVLSLSYLFLFLPGEGVVPEQENEVEAGQRRTARSRSSREGTGECEKGNPSPVRAVRDWCGYPPADRGLASK